MTRSRSLARFAAVLLIGAGLTGCNTLRAMNIFHGAKKKNAIEGTRIPVLTENQKLEPSPALKGVEFSLPPATAVAAWPLPGGTPEQSVEHPAAADAFQIAWRRNIGRGDSRTTHVMATPVSSDGRIYTMDGQAQITALDQSGHEIWRANLANKRGRDREAWGGGIAYDNGVLYVTSGYRFVAALDASTGATKWRTPTDNPVHGAPNVVGGRVYVVDLSDQLLAFDAANGQVAWSYQAIEEPARMLEASSPAVSNGVVVSPFASGEVIALSALNGNDVWNYVLSQTNRNNALSEIRDIAGRPVIYRGDVLAGSHSGVFAAIDLRTGQPRWTLPITTITTPWPAGDVVYVTDTQGRLICIARDSGQIYWIVDLNTGVKKKKDRGVWSGPMLASNHLIVVSDKGEARALDPKTGARQASLKLGEPAFISPIAVNGTAYVVTERGDLVAIR